MIEFSANANNVIRFDAPHRIDWTLPLAPPTVQQSTPVNVTPKGVVRALHQTAAQTLGRLGTVSSRPIGGGGLASLSGLEFVRVR